MPKRKQLRPWEITPDPAVMNPQRVMDSIKSSGTKQIRAEYTRLRDIMQKRIKRGGLDITVPKLSELKGNADLAKEFAYLNRVVASETTTAAGRKRIKQREIATLQEHKFTGITMSNIDDFNRYMEWYREKYTAELPEGRKQIFDSDSAVLVFREISKNIDAESTSAQITRQFNDWMRKNGEKQGIGTLDDINRQARNARRRAARHKKKKQQAEQE